MCFCSVPLLTHHVLLSTHTPLYRSFYWQEPPLGLLYNRMHDMICLCLGWRPISRTSMRQILFDKVYVRACATYLLGDIVLAGCRFCLKANTPIHAKPKYSNMFIQPRDLYELPNSHIGAYRYGFQYQIQKMLLQLLLLYIYLFLIYVCFKLRDLKWNDLICYIFNKH